MITEATHKIAITDQMLDVPDGQIFARRWSNTDTSLPPIILLHDSLGSVEQWRRFPAALSEATKRDIIAYDRLGFGRSTAQAEPLPLTFIDDEAEIFFPALLNAFEIEHFVLFGHSVGGELSLAIASNVGERCEAVITESAQAFIESHTLEAIRVAKKHFSDPVEFKRLQKWHGDKAQWVLDAWTETWLSPGFENWCVDPYLPSVVCPVLAIHGDSDQFGSSEFPRRIVSGLSSYSDMHIIENCGHVPHREKKDAILGLVAAFLSRLVS